MEKQNPTEKSKSKKPFKLLTRVPWSDFQEWKNCYDFLFSNVYGVSGKKIEKLTETVEFFIDGLDFSNLQKAFNILNIWNSRTDNNTYILGTLLLLEEIIKFISNSYLSFNSNDKKHILSQKIIRVTNLIIDDLKKKNKNIAANMFLVAKEINLPEFIIEIRHICTHKNLPDLNTLMFAIKYLYYWFRVNLWDKQYEIFLKETKSKEKIFEILNELEKKEENKNSYNNAKIKLEGVEAIGSKGKNSATAAVKFKFEIKNLTEILNALVQKFCKFCVFTNNGKVYNEKIKEFGLLLDYIHRVEGELLIILLYKFISEFAFYEIAMKIMQEAGDDENSFRFSVNKVIDENRKTLKKLTFLVYFIQKFLSNKEQFRSGNCGDFVLESFEPQGADGNKKDKKLNKNYNNACEENSHLYPLLLNYVFDLLKYAQDFSIEIREIFEMFCCNFKQFCEAFNTTNKMNSISAIFLNEENLEKTLLGNKRDRLGEEMSDKDGITARAPSGSLIFRQLEMISSGNLPKENKNFVYDEIKNLEKANGNEDCCNNYNYNDGNQEYNFTYMDKKLRKMLEKENKKKLLKEKEEEDRILLQLNEDCFVIDLKPE